MQPTNQCPRPFRLTKKPENEKYLSKGRIPVEEVSEISFVIGEEKETSTVVCDKYDLAGFKTDKVIREDFIALNEYFQRINEHDFEITNKQVDQMIRQKIGNKVCTELKKYMIYSNMWEVMIL